VRSKNYFPQTRQIEDKRKVRIVVGSVAALAVLLIAFPSALSSSGDESKNVVTTKVNPAKTYRAFLSQYDAAWRPLSAAITSATAAVTIDDERLQSDATTYTNNVYGVGCRPNIINPGYYKSCVSGEDQTAQSALDDERSAGVAKREDLSQQIKNIETMESAISVFVQELNSVTWPSSVAPVESSLTQSLDDYREAYGKAQVGLSYDQLLSAYSENISAAQSTTTTELTDMATALHIPSPSTPTQVK
jgi:hypothetical protein